MTHYEDILQSPVGPLWIQADNTHLLAVLYDRAQDPVSKPNDITETCRRQLSEYFEGEHTDFDVPFKLQGTSFQESVWGALLDVPFGQIATYGEQAARLKNPKAVRAVGAANGRNIINIIVPCHRIIGGSGSLTGYGGGLKRKKWLLEHESCVTKSRATSEHYDA